jgi:F-type H+-transporting ATPase subunit delta
MSDGTSSAIRGESGAALARVADAFEPVLQSAGAQGSELGTQLFSVADALVGSGSLRRTLTDPSVPAEVKRGVTGQILGAFDSRVQDVVGELVSQRWAAEGDLGRAIEHLGLGAVLASAEARSALATVEDELFRVTRTLAAQRELRVALSEASASVESRTTLARSVFAGKLDDATLILVVRATENLTAGRFVSNLSAYSDAAAARRKRLVANVVSAVELDEAQLGRLGAILERAYGRPAQINVTIDAEVLGGLRIQVGPDVIDSTMLARLDDARRRLAS